MGLVQCKDCGKNISAYASFCPRCGRPGDGSYPMPIEVRDVDMKFGSMITFMVKAAIASIPAMVILIFIGMLVFGFFGFMFGMGRH